MTSSPSESAGFDSLAELREDIATRLREGEERAIEREFEEAVLEAAVGEATVEVPAPLVHARAHELLEQTLSTLERQGIAKETYLQIVGKDEEQLAHEAEPEAASALRREAVLAAIVQAEGIAPSDEDVREALAPAAERAGRELDELMAQLEKSGRIDERPGGRRHAPGARAARARGQGDHRRAGEGAPETVDSGPRRGG